MSITTAAPRTEQVPSSRAEPDLGRIARGEPRDHIDGVPVYRWGQAPPYLRTETQLADDRLKLAAGQAPLAYIRLQKYGDVALYDPAGAAKMKPLASSVKARMAKRRTCPECGKVRDEILRGRTCSVCRERAERERLRLLARTCAGCDTVRERPYPKEHRRCQNCRKEQLEKKRERIEAWLVEVTVCAGDDCTAKISTKTAALAWLRERNWLLRPERPDLPDEYSGWHGERRCPPCAEAYEQEQERLRAEYQERYRRQAEEIRERARKAEEERQRWAAAALVDPDVVVLDTETTGLDATARIVEVAVLSSSGTVLLDTLLDPGEPIPRDATELHGIGNSDVAGAPTFSELLVKLTGVLDGKRVLIYNKWFDIDRLEHELTLHYRAAGHPDPEASTAAWVSAMRWEDVMHPYSRWVGEWSDYHGDYRWQPLNGGHRAAEDCRAVLDCLRVMGRPNGGETDVYETAGSTGEGTA
ncbi:exonuclease domain-containing protein [Streptomyces sp. NPDC059679]|uniref:exonuclease domain-containing protein n=1 Tax=Streptomyces sp. NPDC059679 TaxID=3346903 RepID=UPI0036A7ACBD